jgi:hypothetical protein
MPKARKYYNDLGAFAKKRKKVFYDLPERGIQMENYQKEKVLLEEHWDAFVYNLKSANVIKSKEIVTRAQELQIKTDNLNKMANEMKAQEFDSLYFKNLNKRKNLLHYIMELKKNKGIDVNNIVEGDFDEPRSENLGKLKEDRLFWRNLGEYYNNSFPGGFDHHMKMSVLEIQMVDINKQLDQMEREDEMRQRQMEEDRQRELVRQRETEYIELHQFQNDSHNQYEDPKENEMEMQRHVQEEFMRREEMEKERMREMEQENLELEDSIRKLETQKRRIEVDLIRMN